MATPRKTQHSTSQRNSSAARHSSATRRSSAPSRDTRSAAPRQSKKPKWGKFVALFALVVVVALGGFGAFHLMNTEDSAASGSSSAQPTPAPEPVDAGPKKTAAGNQAVSHVRTPEERKATSSSANDQKPGPKTVYLTFDDGPSTNTHRILDILDTYGVKATWFVKGNQPQLNYVKDIWDANHQIAIHTYTHNYTDVYASPEAYWKDFHMAGEAIEEHLGFRPTLVRFPGGSRNSYNSAVFPTVERQMADQNIHYFDWNISSGDGGDHDAQFIIDYVLEQAEGCHSCCVLMHDSAAKDTTVEALPTIIEWYIDNGFEFDVLTADSFGYHF